jgi:hypothetical protein
MTGKAAALPSAIDLARVMLSERARELNRVGKKSQTADAIRMVGNRTRINQ